MNGTATATTAVANGRSASTAAPLLELRDITTLFGHGAGATVANDRVSLTIEEQPPRLVSIVGESGSGKTTAARSLLGLQPPSTGETLWRGKDITALSKDELLTFRHEVQAVFQDPYGIFNPFYRINRVFDMTIKKFKLATSKDEKERLIEEALRAVNLRPPDVLGRYPHQLSGGERQRVMLARAYLLKPKVIVADEAISMLDVAVRAVIMNIIVDFKENLGISTVFITHDLSAAYYLGGDIMVMHRGRVVETGDSVTVMREPKHPYTRLLLQSIPSPDPDERWANATIAASEQDDTNAAMRQSRQRCLFAERCPYVMEMCWQHRPPLFDADSQRAACYLFDPNVQASGEAASATERARVTVEDANRVASV
jgi:oligopeptide/dipeptide ABC transporter ATP-binding protein